MTGCVPAAETHTYLVFFQLFFVCICFFLTRFYKLTKGFALICVFVVS